jgi:hypothetical protein
MSITANATNDLSPVDGSAVSLCDEERRKKWPYYKSSAADCKHVF